MRLAGAVMVLRGSRASLCLASSAPVGSARARQTYSQGLQVVLGQRNCVTKNLQFIDWFRSGRRSFFVMSRTWFEVWTHAAIQPAMNDITTNEVRLFAKPRFAGLDASRPSVMLPARFRPSIALPPRPNPARRLPTANFLTSADRAAAPASNLLPPSECRSVNLAVVGFQFRLQPPWKA